MPALAIDFSATASVMTTSTDMLTPKQVARAIGVSESSLKRWCDQGVLETVRTAGGHRRITFAAVLAFLKATGRPMVRPDLLGLPATSGTGERVLERAVDRLQTSLVQGDAALCRQVIFDLHLAHHSIATICDRVVRPCFEQIGAGWECGEVQVYEERRACEIISRVLHELEGFVPQGDETAPLAIGGTTEGDFYDLATTMVALVLRQSRWRATSLGAALPFETLLAAIAKQQPKLFWISVSYIADEPKFLAEYNTFFAAASQHTKVAIGGRALTSALREQMRYHVFCDRLIHLEDFVRSLT